MVEDRWFIYQHPPGHYETSIYRNGCAGYIHSLNEPCIHIPYQLDYEAYVTIEKLLGPDFVPPDGTKEN